MTLKKITTEALIKVLDKNANDLPDWEMVSKFETGEGIVGINFYVDVEEEVEE